MYHYGNEIDNKCTECYSNYTLNGTNCYQICQYFYYFDSSNIYHCTFNNSCPNEYNKLIIDKSQCIDKCENDDKYIYENENICLENEIIISTFIVTEKIDKISDNNNNSFTEITDNSDNINNIVHTYNIDITDNIVQTHNTDTFDNIDNTHNIYNIVIIDNTDNNNNVDNTDKKYIDYEESSNIKTYIYKNNTNLIIKEYEIDSLSYENKNKEFIYAYSILELFNIKSIIKDKNETEKENIIIKLNESLLNKEIDELITTRIQENNEDLIIYFDDAIYQYTSTFNQNNNIYNNLSIIQLKECESILKVHYNISQNESLLIFKIDKLGDGFLISIVEYEVYNIKTKEKLDLNLCKDIKISIIYPINIDKKNLFKYNSSSSYYNDICYPHTTENNTDICLKDRQNEYEEYKMYICEVNCDFNNYNSESKKVECKCQIKTKFHLFSEIIINKDKFLTNFIEIKNIINLCLMKCYKVLFTKEGLISNAGSYILLSIIVCLFVLLFLFKIKGYKIFFSLIDNIILKRKPVKIKKRKKKSKKGLNIKNISNPIKKKIVKKKIKNKNKGINIKNNFLKTSGDKIFDNSCLKLDKKKNNKRRLNIKANLKSFAGSNKNKILKKNNRKYLNDYELNTISYKEALKIDKRTYFEYYLSLIRIKHLLIFSFYTSNDYNSKIIKISLFLFIFSLNFTVNALFFNDSTMHKIYIEYGNFIFINNIPQILYSTIISSFINLIASFLSLTEKSVVKLNQTKKNNNLRNNIEKMKKMLTIKFILFYFFIFLLLAFFWYYLACFCAVYRNTQIHLIKDTLITFLTTLIYPFILCLLPGIFRIAALKSKKGDKLFLYKFSIACQLL